MRIAILGTGGVGGYYGGRLAQAGEDVIFIARGANLAALRQHGLRIFSPLGDFHLPHVQATDDTSNFGPVDLVLVSVKTYSTNGATSSLPALLGPQTTVLSLQNGIDSAERFGAVVGMAHMLGALTYISAELVAPGEVRHVFPFARIVIGEFNREVTERLQRVQAALQGAGVQTELSDDIERDLWIKFMAITVQAATTSLTRLSIGPIRDNPPSWQLYLEALREVEAIARVKGVRLPPNAAEQRHASASGMPAAFKSSMLADIENGRRLEIEDFSGAIVRLGEQLGVPTPIHRAFYALLSVLDQQVQSHPTL